MHVETIGCYKIHHYFHIGITSFLLYIFIQLSIFSSLSISAVRYVFCMPFGMFFICRSACFLYAVRHGIHMPFGMFFHVPFGMFSYAFWHVIYMLFGMDFICLSTYCLHKKKRLLRYLCKGALKYRSCLLTLVNRCSDVTLHTPP